MVESNKGAMNGAKGPTEGPSIIPSKYTKADIKGMVIQSAAQTMATELATVVVQSIMPKIAMAIPAFLLGPVAGIGVLLLTKPLYHLLHEAKLMEDLNQIDQIISETSLEFFEDWNKYKQILNVVDQSEEGKKKLQEAKRNAEKSFNKFVGFSLS